jgi:Tn3 transposase DDE domain
MPYTYLRQFTPNVLAAIDFKGGPGTTDLMAVAILKTLNETGVRKVPADAPESFVPTRYADYLAKARKGGDDTAYRHYLELCVILGLRDGLRSGDVYVPGSRRYADPATYLYTPAQRKPRQADYCRLVGKPARAADALEQGREELHTALAEMENALAGALPDDTGTVRLDADDHLVIPKLTAEDIPAEAKELKEELSGMLPFAPIASLLIELDGRTGFLDCFTHADGKKLAHGNATDLPITEHTTDTHGATLINFDLVGKALTPRMRDLTKITLVRDDTPTEIGKLYPHAGPLLAAR